MKWVKVAIGAVIAILSIGIIATSVYGMTQEKDVIDIQEITSTTVSDVASPVGNVQTISLTPPINSDLNQYDFTTLEGDVIFYIYRDDTMVFSGNASIETATTVGNDYNIFIEYNSTTENAYLQTVQSLILTVGFVNHTTLTAGDTITIVVDNSRTIPPQLTGTTATLILLTPLIFAGGVLAYLLNKQNY